MIRKRSKAKLFSSHKIVKEILSPIT